MVQPCTKNLHSSISNACFTKMYGISSIEIHSNYNLRIRFIIRITKKSNKLDLGELLL